MNSIKFLFVVWAFLVLGGIARCKPPYPSEPRFSPRTLSFSTEGSDSAEGSNVDALDTNLARIAGAAARIAGATARITGADGVCRRCRGQRVHLSQVHRLHRSRVRRSTDWFDFLARSTLETAKPLLPRPGYSVVNGWGRSQLFVSFGDTTRSVVQRKAIFVLKHRKAKLKGSETWKENAWHI